MECLGGNGHDDVSNYVSEDRSGGRSDNSLFSTSRRSPLELPGREADSGELYRSLFEENHSVMLIIDPETGEILDANASACLYYKYAKEQLTRLQIMDINTLSPEQVREEMQNAKTEKRSHFEFRHKLADGEVRDVEVYCSPVEISGKRLKRYLRRPTIGL